MRDADVDADVDGPRRPREVAAALVAAFDATSRHARPVSQVCGEAAEAMSDPVDARDEAVQRACVAIARSIDDQRDHHDRHAYHNRQHFCEVILTAMFLCRLHRLPSRDARLVLLAALIHDLEHDGVTGNAFEYERRSVARSAPVLARAGVDETDYQAIAALVVATDLRHGVPAVTAIWRWHIGEDPTDPDEPPAVELRPLLGSPTLAHAAVLLCEADVLPSLGLTLSHALRLQDRLAREWGRQLPADDKLRFIDDVVATGVIGDFFLPNVLANRRALGGRVHAA